MSNEFKGDNKALIGSMNALLALDAKGSLAPHGIGGHARVLLEACIARLPEQHQGEPVAPYRYLVRSTGGGPMSRKVNEAEESLWKTEEHARQYHGKGKELTADQVAGRTVFWPDEYQIVPLYTHADAGEVERLQVDLGLSEHNFRSARGDISILECKLEEREALLRESRLCVAEAADPEVGGPTQREAQEILEKIDAALSASAEPSKNGDTELSGAESGAPTCETCKGNGVVGWQRGQTPEQFEQGEDECADCLGTGHAHNQGMAVSGACTTCHGLGHVPDGAITGVGAVEFENGPVECIKDCPDCAPVERKPTDDIPDFTPGGGNKAERRATELVAQLQRDLTARDEENDALRSGFVFETGPYQVEMTEEQWIAALDVFENYNMGDEQHFVFLEDQGRGIISEILIAIGVARAPDADEVVE